MEIFDVSRRLARNSSQPFLPWDFDVCYRNSKTTVNFRLSVCMILASTSPCFLFSSFLSFVGYDRIYHFKRLTNVSNGATSADHTSMREMCSVQKP